MKIEKVEIVKMMDTKLPVGEIVDIKKNSDGSWNIIQKKVTCAEFVLIEAEELSMEDEFMKYKPKTARESRFKDAITEAIDTGVKNFWKSKYDASLTEDQKICFEAGKMPAVGKPYSWWKEEAKNYLPERNSRLGTRLEYIAFLGVLIKKLIESGKSIEWAWDAICNDSHELGHYWDSEDTNHDLEPTGSRDVFGFCDLANIDKILGDESRVFWIASGSFRITGKTFPLSCVVRGRNDAGEYGVGWIVLEK